jgi:hypothetical protein
VLGDIWNKAADVTGDIVNVIKTKDLDDEQFYKFPRNVEAPPIVAKASTNNGQLILTIFSQYFLIIFLSLFSVMFY